MDQIDTDVQEAGECANCHHQESDLHLFHDAGPFCRTCWATAAEEWNQEQREAYYDKFYGPNRGGY